MCQAWWGTLGVYPHYHHDFEHLAWVLERGTDDSPPAPLPPPFLPPDFPSLCFGTDRLQCHMRGQDSPSVARVLQRQDAPEKHVVNVVKIIIKMMRRMTWASIYERPKSSVKS